MVGLFSVMGHEKCESYLIFSGEAALGDNFRTFLYFLGLAYCFLGLSAITARFFKSMENVVKHTRKVVEIDPVTQTEVVRHEKVWNYTIADISLLAFGTSFPQISLATIDAIRNVGNLYAGGLGPGTLVGSAAFDLFPIHAVCVVVPKAGELKKIADIGVWLVELFWSFWAYIWLYIILKVWTPDVVTLWEALLTVLQYGLLLTHAYAQDKRWPYISLPIERDERPEEWVPEESPYFIQESLDKMDFSETSPMSEEYGETVDIFSIHSVNPTDQKYERVHQIDDNVAQISDKAKEMMTEDVHLLKIWRQQFVDALTLESLETKKLKNSYLRMGRILWQSLLIPWRFLFAFVPPCHIAHGWISFICSLLFISGIAYIVTRITDLISCVTGINAYVIAFTALASGTSWPDLVASKIAAERQITADSAIANITCSNSVNIYVGIGVPWLIDTLYNFIAYREPLRIQDAGGLSFSLLVFFSTSVGCISVLVLRRLIFGAELGGPRIWAWITCVYFMFLWIIFVVLSSLKVSGDEHIELVVPPVFDNCTKVVAAEDGIAARELYWDAVCGKKEGLERKKELLLGSIEKNPFADVTFLLERESGVDVERERWVREEAWVGTLSLLGCWGENKVWVFGWRKKWVGRMVERERDSEATANGGGGGDPLFVDQYASYLVPQNFHKEKVQDLNPYCLATKFIDDKLLHTVNLIDGVKQVVLLTDGMDTRPYRLRWPASTIIFDISPERIFQIAAEKLEGDNGSSSAGAKVPKGSLLYHIPLESSDIKQNLQLRGYNGSRPSIWAMQGFPMMTLANFEEVLSMLSSLAMEGSFFLGELPTFLSDAETEIKRSAFFINTTEVSAYN
ncbi:hypothetical protein Ahy_A02g005900 isoform A [Arachis hypogaea]|uniref:Sodium/calcium exchanger membrane region domain-containing protein n=1 Tax=Arachis hypogaea TaxID=3818 RepID=A0A445E820_ARAHY|nr:hypothetical protein Ahy_A02g005900 isoform A [Arachis hypogaea]